MGNRRGELRRAEETEGVLCQTHIGGQALIEGVMMRGKYSWAAAVRTPEGGIYTEEHDLKTRQDRHGWLYWPVIRGCRALVESLMLGYKALGVSTEHAFEFDEDDEKGKAKELPAEEAAPALAEAAEVAPAEAETLPAEPATPEPAPVAATEPAPEPPAATAFPAAPKPAAEPAPKEEKKDGEGKVVMVIGSVLGIVLGLALFIMLPAWLSNLIVGNYDDNIILWNVVDGVLRVAVFVFYVWLISRMKDINRMFRYHGAEHKTIHCYEHGLELTPENAQQFPTLHVRCGTAFLIMTLILAIIVFSMVPVKAICVSLGLTGGIGQFAVIVLSRIVFIPLVAGLGYELTVKWAGAHPERPIVRAVLWPGLQMQKLTTGQPDDDMIECAIAAMKIVLAREEREERKETEAADEVTEVGETGSAAEAPGTDPLPEPA